MAFGIDFLHHFPFPIGHGTCSFGQEGACRSLSVVSVSGTDISRIADYAENLRMPLGLHLVFVSISDRLRSMAQVFFFSTEMLEKLMSNSHFFLILLALLLSDRLYLQFLESFFLYLVQVDRACSVADPSNDVSNDSHLAS